MTARNPLSPPADLDSRSKELWKRTIDQLREQKTWEDQDAPVLERYIRSMEVARLARGRTAERAKRDPEGAYVSKGSHGGFVVHPDLKTARDAERDAQEYAQSLFLTPRARKQHDIKPAIGRGRLQAVLDGDSANAESAPSAPEKARQPSERGLRAVSGEKPGKPVHDRREGA